MIEEFKIDCIVWIMGVCRYHFKLLSFVSFMVDLIFLLGYIAFFGAICAVLTRISYPNLL